MKINKRKGFTLTEVLVVVLIISVIAAIVYPLYSRAIVKSRAAEAINLLEMVRNKQLQKFARDGEYFSDLSGIGKLTNSDNQKALPSGALKVNDYTLKVNDSGRCVSATYEKGSTRFTFSSSYEKAGLGCTGAICSSFGDIIGTTEEVCSYSSENQPQPPVVACSGSASSPCGKCGKMYRVCNSVTGIWGDYGSCTGEGSCSPGETAQCEGGGIKTCGPSCSWGGCEAPKPGIKCQGEAVKSCGKCGTQNRICNPATGQWSQWSTCSGEGECYPGKSGKSCDGDNKGVQYRTCSKNCTWSAGWDTSGCTPKTQCPAECKPGYKRDLSIKFIEDGECCVHGTMPCPDDCSMAPMGYIRTDAEYADAEGLGCCADACDLPSGKNTCSCWAYASNPVNVCECFSQPPFYGSGMATEDLCKCPEYKAAHKRECCLLEEGTYNSSNNTCSMPSYEWQVVNNNEIWRNGYTCPGPDIIGSVCSNVLTNSYYFTNPEIDNLPICGSSCTKAQLYKKCKYCEVTYTRVCPGYPSGGGPEAVKKTKTCVSVGKVVF